MCAFFLCAVCFSVEKFSVANRKAVQVIFFHASAVHRLLPPLKRFSRSLALPFRLYFFFCCSDGGGGGFFPTWTFHLHGLTDTFNEYARLFPILKKSALADCVVCITHRRRRPRCCLLYFFFVCFQTYMAFAYAENMIICAD